MIRWSGVVPDVHFTVALPAGPGFQALLKTADNQDHTARATWDCIVND